MQQIMDDPELITLAAKCVSAAMSLLEGDGIFHDVQSACKKYLTTLRTKCGTAECMRTLIVWQLGNVMIEAIKVTTAKPTRAMIAAAEAYASQVLRDMEAEIR